MSSLARARTLLLFRTVSSGILQGSLKGGREREESAANAPRNENTNQEKHNEREKKPDTYDIAVFSIISCISSSRLVGSVSRSSPNNETESERERWR